MKCSVLNASELTGGCLTAALSKRNMLHFLCGGHTAVGGGNGTRKNIPACVHERQNNRTAASIRLPYQASVHIMDLDQDFWQWEINNGGGEKAGTVQ